MIPISVLVLLFILVVFMPALCWIGFFRFFDRAEPEPWKLMIKVFLFGILAAIISVFAEEYFLGFLYDGTTEEAFEAIDALMYSNVPTVTPFWVYLTFFMAGPIEELVKFLLLKWAVYRKTAFNQIADGAIYGITLALGFTVIENAFYFFDMHSNMGNGDFVMGTVMRGLMTVLIHILSTGIAGLYLGRAKFSRKYKFRNVLLGISVAALIHGIYNLLVLTSGGFLIGLPAIVFGFVIFLKVLKRGDSQIVWKLIKP